MVGVLAEYEPRLHNGVELYLAYLRDPHHWPPERRGRTVRETARSTDTPTGQARHELALAGGRTASFGLPLDLDQADVERICRFLRTLPLDEDDDR